MILSFSHMVSVGQVWYLIVSIPDVCFLPYFIILNLEQWTKCCVKSSIFSSGSHFVPQSRTL